MSFGFADMFMFQGVNALIQGMLQNKKMEFEAEQKVLDRRFQETQKNIDRELQREFKEADRSEKALDRKAHRKERESERAFQHNEAELQRRFTASQLESKYKFDAEVRRENVDYQERQSVRRSFINNFPLNDELETLALGSQDDDDVVSACRRLFVRRHNGKDVLPCFFLTAFQGKRPLIDDFNFSLSSFLAEHYNPNQKHAVLSKIGSWKIDSEVSDAQIRRIHSIFKEFPMMICVPYFFDRDRQIAFKIWVWGFNDQQDFPSGIEFCRIDLARLKSRLILEESLKWQEIVNIDPSVTISPCLAENFKWCDRIKNKNFSSEQRKTLESTLRASVETENAVEEATTRVISNISFCAVGMFADLYHGSYYATPPKLPSLLHTLIGIEGLTPYIRRFYAEFYRNVKEVDLDESAAAEHFALCIALEKFCAANGDSEGKEIFKQKAIALFPRCPRKVQNESVDLIDLGTTPRLTER